MGITDADVMIFCTFRRISPSVGSWLMSQSSEAQMPCLSWSKFDLSCESYSLEISLLKWILWK